MDTVRYVIGWGEVVLHNFPSFQETCVEDTTPVRRPSAPVRFYTLSYHDMQKPVPFGTGFYARYSEGFLDNT